MRHAQCAAEQLTNQDRTKQNPTENLVSEVAAALVAPQMAKLQKTCFCEHFFFSKSGSNKRRKERMSVLSKVKMVKWTFCATGCLINQAQTEFDGVPEYFQKNISASTQSQLEQLKNTICEDMLTE